VAKEKLTVDSRQDATNSHTLISITSAWEYSGGQSEGRTAEVAPIAEVQSLP
jgi:hypothetical protein